MQVKQNKKFTAKYILGLFLSTAVAPFGMMTLSADVYAAEKEQKIEETKSLGIKLRDFYNEYYKDTPTFAFQTVTETVEKSTSSQAVTKYAAEPLTEGQKNLAYFQHELSKILGSNGNEIVNRVLGTAFGLCTGEHIKLYADKTKPAHEMLETEIARYAKAINIFAAQQNEAFKDVVAIIMSSLPPKDVIAELNRLIENSKEKDVNAIKGKGKSIAQMFFAYQLLKGQQTYVSAFMHFMKENLESLQDLAKQHKQDLALLQEKVKGENIQEDQNHTLKVDELNREISSNEKQISLLTACAQQGAANNNLSELQSRKAGLVKSKEKLEADYKAFHEKQVLQESTLLDQQKKSVHSKIDAMLVDENKLYANFRLAFAALGRSSYFLPTKTLSYGMFGTRETLAVWGDLDIAVHKMNKELAKKDAFFHKAFFHALDRFKYKKQGGGKDTQPSSAVEFTAEDMKEFYGTDLPTIKTAVLEMFSIPAEDYAEAQVERQQLLAAINQSVKVQETLTAVEKDIQSNETNVVNEQSSKSPEDALKENIAKVVNVTSAATTDVANETVTSDISLKASQGIPQDQKEDGTEAQKKSLEIEGAAIEPASKGAITEEKVETTIEPTVMSTDSINAEITEQPKVSDLSSRELLRPESPEFMEPVKPSAKEEKLYDSFYADASSSSAIKPTTDRYSSVATDVSKTSRVSSLNSEPSSREARLASRSSYTSNYESDQKKNQSRSDLYSDSSTSYTRGESCITRNRRTGDSATTIEPTTTRRSNASSYSTSYDPTTRRSNASSYNARSQSSYGGSGSSYTRKGGY